MYYHLLFKFKHLNTFVRFGDLRKIFPQHYCVICLKVCMKSLVVYVFNTINKSIKYINTYLILTFVFICKKGHNFGISSFDNCLFHPQKCIFHIKPCRCTVYCFIMSIAICRTSVVCNRFTIGTCYLRKFQFQERKI